ncbi:uncharacterized protein RHIMIDRAFT_237818 [Rhizopus microsporus ATCC 52813]|uniref:BZIP domain-containing protein n=1 Tax=Rhizopus microsporus ATCC 52813 TaxID=1340429 RepID=A0A2G4STC9_RHIZD|nr:uncharacterized protein RHIMIDRAFT_237818 [Rhizopus microsporus ATCC 52813]PHZ12002.1 hypothetical protein RHIMIDRAFT_237818 [Rhizopus microsporus ATCC 52813]
MSLSITPRQCDKPMSISSITLPPSYSDFSVTPPISPSKKIQLHQPLSPHFSCSVPSSPESVTDQSILSSTFLIKLEHQSNQSTNNGSNNASLSLHERRQRNKAASAKYRAKKNQQHGEMRSRIMSLSQENDILQRQLESARQENHKLREACDKLRGKMLAENVLHKLLYNNNNNGIHGDDLCDVINDAEEEEDEYLTVQQSQSLNRCSS